MKRPTVTSKGGGGRSARLAGLTCSAVLALLTVVACSSGASTTSSSGSGGSAAASSGSSAGDSSNVSPIAQAEAYDKATSKAKKPYKIASFNTCTNLNAWCEAMIKFEKQAAAKYGVDLTIYDAAFDPTKQLNQVQDAIAKGGWDGFIFQPVAAAPGCQMIRTLLATGIPVEQGNSPVCEDEDYHAGTVGFVSTSTENYYKDYLKTVFGSCTSPCQALVVGGVSGQDGWRRLQDAISQVKPNFPNVDIVTEQPGNYDPNQALKITQDALQSHPNISLVLSAYDEMSRGMIQALQSAGKSSGVKLYSIGGTPYGLSQVKAGSITATIQSDPYPEGYYTVVELVRFLDTGKKTTGFSDTNQWEGILDGPGSPILTQANVDKYKPDYG